MEWRTDIHTGRTRKQNVFLAMWQQTWLYERTCACGGTQGCGTGQLCGSRCEWCRHGMQIQYSAGTLRLYKSCVSPQIPGVNLKRPILMGARTNVGRWVPTPCSLVLHEMKVTLRKDAGAANGSLIPVTLEAFFHLWVLVTGKEGASFWRLLFIRNCFIAQCKGTQSSLSVRCILKTEPMASAGTFDQRDC